MVMVKPNYTVQLFVMTAKYVLTTMIHTVVSTTDEITNKLEPSTHHQQVNYATSTTHITLIHYSSNVSLQKKRSF